MLEIWRGGGPDTGASADMARTVEAEGWDGQVFMCSQCICPDPYAQMAIWAHATEHLQVATGVTNPLTRNLAVTASAIATIQSISGGRAVLGFGRGDSALAHLGHAPVGIKRFETSLKHLQMLLSGEAIPFDEFGPSGDAPPVSDLSHGGMPEAVRLEWLPQGMPKVPLEVAATGPKVIAMSARLADRVTFSVGAQKDRLEWALEIAGRARESAGMSTGGVSYGAQLVVICNPDQDEAMKAATSMTSALARFQVMEGRLAGPANEEAVRNFEAVAEGYDMTAHVDLQAADKVKGGGLSEEFVRDFAVVGNPDQVTEKLLGLKRLGLERFVLIGPPFYPADWSADVRALFAREVMPVLKAQD